jgi:site-specific DNA-methyltransferase (adenine-specific)
MYSLLLCDPPWKYNDKAQAGNRGAEFKYPCMTTHELYKMHDYINEISNNDSVLYMWTTGPMLPDALGTMKFWGFKFKNIAFTWIKTNKKPLNWVTPSANLIMGIDDDDKEFTTGDFMGMGNHTRSNAEFVLLGVRGKGIKRVSASVRSTVISPVREHSRKPDEVRRRIEDLYGDVPRIELFARERFEGWDFHGNEVIFNV